MPNKIVDIYNHTLGHKGFDYDQMTDEVFIGTNMCCQFGFNRELLSKDVKADISLEKERIDSPIGVDYFLWLPTEDYQAPSPDQLSLGVATLKFLIDKKIKVYVHCKNGHGRAPTLFAAYLISQGASVDGAIKTIQEKRPGIHLTKVQIAALQAFKN